MTVTLDDTLRIAGPLIEIDPREARIRAGCMALAQDLLLCLPPGEERDEVVRQLEGISERAVQALAA